MSNPTPQAYLCPHCEEVVSANPEAQSGLILCPSCGEEFASLAGAPTSREAASQSDAVVRDLTAQDKKPEHAEPPPQKIPARETPLPAKKKVASGGSHTSGDSISRHRKKRSKRSNKPYYLILLGWFALLTTVVLIFNTGQEDEAQIAREGVDPETRELQLRTQRNRQFLKIHKEAAEAVLGKYVNSINPLERQQVIDNSIELASVFARYYEINQIEILRKDRRLVHANIIDSPFGPAMELVWIDSRGNALETLMLWDGDEWRIDWEQMVRYSESPWNLFQSGIGPREGVFRVYARKQATEDQKNIHVVLYGPWPKAIRPDSTLLKKLAIPGISIPADSDLGRELDKIFKKRASPDPADSSAFAMSDPEVFVRLTARLRFAPGADDTPGDYEILNILAPNWHGRRLREAEKREAREEKAAEK